MAITTGNGDEATVGPTVEPVSNVEKNIWSSKTSLRLASDLLGQLTQNDDTALVSIKHHIDAASQRIDAVALSIASDPEQYRDGQKPSPDALAGAFMLLQGMESDLQKSAEQLKDPSQHDQAEQRIFQVRSNHGMIRHCNSMSVSLYAVLYWD